MNAAMANPLFTLRGGISTNHFPRDEAECGTGLDFGVSRRRRGFPLAIWDRTVMEGKSASLVLENEAASMGCQSASFGRMRPSAVSLALSKMQARLPSARRRSIPCSPAAAPCHGWKSPSS